jgi:O-antigen/teichoic acid export membrane protein
MVANSSNEQPDTLTRSLGLGHKSLGLKMVRGVIFSVVRKVVAGPLFLLLVPFTMHKVGAAGYGSWALLMTVISISGFLDWGLGESIIKHVAEYNGKKDVELLRRILNATFALYLCIATLTVCVLALCSHQIIKQLFHGAAAPVTTEMLALWPLLLVTVAADILARPFSSVINGFQRIDLTNVVLFIHSLINSLLTVAFLLAGAKIGGLLLATLLSSLFNLAAYALITQRLLPAIMPNPLSSDFTTLKRICSFSLALFSGRMMFMIQAQVEKLYLARFAGVIQVGWYEVASEAASKVRRLPDQLLSPVMAAASGLHASDEKHKMRELYFRTNKYFAVVAIPFVVFALFTAKALMNVWLGPGLVQIAVPFAGLVLGNLFLQVGAPISAVLTGRGVLRPGVYAALMMCVMNLVMSFVFIQRWGFAGAMLGTVLSMILGMTYFFIAAAPHFEIPIHQTLSQAYVKPMLCSCVAAAAMWPTRIAALIGLQRLALSGVVYGVVYLTGLILTRFFDRFDLARAEKYLPLFRMAKRMVPVQLRPNSDLGAL